MSEQQTTIPADPQAIDATIGALALGGFSFGGAVVLAVKYLDARFDRDWRWERWTGFVLVVAFLLYAAGIATQGDWIDEMEDEEITSQTGGSTTDAE